MTMGTFKTENLLNGNKGLIPAISKEIEKKFKSDGYKVDIANLIGGGKNISIAKCGFFRSVLGLKTAMKVNLIPHNDRIMMSTGVGIFGLQAIPSFITLFFAWPVIFTQICGVIQQKKLVEKVIGVVKNFILVNDVISHESKDWIYCPADGSKLPAGTQFCPHCGTEL